MSASESVKRFSRRVVITDRRVFVNVVSHVLESIVNGSPVTGAPGQPVDTGNLRNSWSSSFPTPTSAAIQTNCEYALHVEDNVRGVTFKNHGPHSVKLTVAGLDKIVAHETALVGGGA